ncbi:hypothetical protein [Brasilonema sp. UFV-L1]|uniref:hypothetical protein n=1 Tax=Brasilonema sp. UFV-L1 TaxID=2234130 RepID=UPI00145CDC74|nr:hypothetical protein [Brasilonema sp. UFV-L1]NMG06084.1 hypothetical protein [Brasilonema sp. UFV-L1]
MPRSAISDAVIRYMVGYSDILQHSQQDPKNRVYKRKIKVFNCRYSQETRFLTLVQDISIPTQG